MDVEEILPIEHEDPGASLPVPVLVRRTHGLWSMASQLLDRSPSAEGAASSPSAQRTASPADTPLQQVMLFLWASLVVTLLVLAVQLWTYWRRRSRTRRKNL